ncbi:MAG: FAD-dependent oxidoreductase [Cellvibrionales bacterium]|nr:FAD-dependent oxidoreductase [Cellvibrionales bacterium]
MYALHPLILCFILLSVSLCAEQPKDKKEHRYRSKCTKPAVIVVLSTVGLVPAGLIYHQKNKPIPISDDPLITNDYSRLNPVLLKNKFKPSTSDDIQTILKNHQGKISIVGAGYSIGGQTLAENSIQIDLSEANRILKIDPTQKEITVQAGIRWNAIQKAIDPFNLAVKNMQSYNDFSVGGSISVNAHGRHWGEGPLINSVKSIKVILATGEAVIASREQNSDLFYSAIGGFGGVGIISEATLALENNLPIKRTSTTFSTSDFYERFDRQIKQDDNIKLYNCLIYPPNFTEAREVIWREAEKPLTINPNTNIQINSKLEKLSAQLLADIPTTKTIRKSIVDPLHFNKSKVSTMNHETSQYQVGSLPETNSRQAPKLYEYFIPERHFDAFINQTQIISKKHQPNILNLSIRHVTAAPENFLSFARENCFAFVFYAIDKTKHKHQAAQRQWNREMIDAAISLDGTFYLPYEIVASPEQFNAAYPNFSEFLKAKAKYDPDNRFVNKLWQTYCPSTLIQKHVSSE